MVRLDWAFKKVRAPLNGSAPDVTAARAHWKGGDESTANTDMVKAAMASVTVSDCRGVVQVVRLRSGIKWIALVKTG